jgi:AraC-like DNA-binding protein
MAMSGRSLSRAGQAPVKPIPQDRVDRPLAAFARDYPGGHDTGWHSHERAQLLYATAGVMRVATGAAGFVVPPGRALWVPAGLPHAVSMRDGVAMRALFVRRDAAGSGPAATAVIAVSPLLRELILAACAEPLEWDQAGRGGHLAALILDEIARARPLPLGVPAPRDPRLLRLAGALGADPARPLTLEAWAAECGASPRTLTRLFRRETGMSFGRWRQMLRLSEAAALLSQGVPAARAAVLVGYASVPAFGSAFRAAFGQTPGGAASRPMDHPGRARTGHAESADSKKLPRDAGPDV